MERMIQYSRTYMKDAQWEKIKWAKYRVDLEKCFGPPGKGEVEVTPQDPDEEPGYGWLQVNVRSNPPAFTTSICQLAGGK